jgi:hypothetical protein
MSLPLDVWAMMLFSAAVFFGVSLWLLVYTLRQEERKMRILQEQQALDTHAPAALDDLRAWIAAHPGDPAVETARARYRECVEALRSTDEHFYDWRDADIRALDDL